MGGIDWKGGGLGAERERLKSSHASLGLFEFLMRALVSVLT